MQLARRIAKAADRGRTRKIELAAKAARISDRRTRTRAKTQAKSSAVPQYISFAAVGALLGYFATHLRLLAPVAAVAGLAGWYFVGHFRAQQPPAPQAGLAAPAKSQPGPPPRPVAADTGQRSQIVADASNARNDEISSMPAKTPVRSAALLAARDPSLDRWFVNSYLRCWAPPRTLPSGEQYAAQIRITHNLDGSIASLPVLVNPPSNPEWRAFANSAVRAVTKCNPLQIPKQYLDHFDQWKKMSLHFSPEIAGE